MYFEPEHCYHIFNQGNNRELIFFNREIYFFFLKKIETHILPFADVLAYCLMPNHFHLMVYVNHPGLTVGVTAHKPCTHVSHPDSIMRTLNNSIGIMLRSYTRAVNNQKNRCGSLFREETKAECLTCNSNITPSFFYTNQGALINISNPGKEYPQVCFYYIHNNPGKAGLVKKPEDWEFSSFRNCFDFMLNKIYDEFFSETRQILQT